MSRSFSDIQKSILDAKEASASLNALEILTTSEQTLSNANATSKVSMWRLWVWIFAFAMWVHEQIIFKLSEQSRPQNIPNFKNTVFNFHDGLEHKFIEGKFQYDFTGISNPHSLKIIKKVAVFENDDEEIVVKIALENNELATDEQLDRIKSYLKNEKPPGAALVLINKMPDELKINFTVWVDTQVIDKVTGRLLGVTDEVYPVEVAIENYLNNLEFNGAFVCNKIEKEIESQTGIKLVNIDSIQWKYEGYPFTDFSIFKVPESGHFKIEPENLTINYLDYALVNS
jgi:hypothetical protein